jgi:hypothetical protein
LGGAKPDQCIAVGTEKAEIGVASRELGLKSGLEFGWLDSRKATFSGAEP